MNKILFPYCNEIKEVKYIQQKECIAVRDENTTGPFISP